MTLVKPVDADDHFCSILLVFSEDRGDADDALMVCCVCVTTTTSTHNSFRDNGKDAAHLILLARHSVGTLQSQTHQLVS
jgi:hypothetical protein